jgi:hypothetical protein
VAQALMEMIRRVIREQANSYLDEADTSNIPGD